MTAIQAHDKAAEIDDQNRRMTGFVVALTCSAFSALAAGLIWIY